MSEKRIGVRIPTFIAVLRVNSELYLSKWGSTTSPQAYLKVLRNPWIRIEVHQSARCRMLADCKRQRKYTIDRLTNVLAASCLTAAHRTRASGCVPTGPTTHARIAYCDKVMLKPERGG